MLTGDDGQTHDRVLVDADQATGLAHAATLLQMAEDGARFVVGQFGTILRLAFAFRGAFLAGATGENAPLFVGAMAETDTRIVEAALAVVGTSRVLATEGSQGAPFLPAQPSTASAARKNDCGLATLV